MKMATRYSKMDSKTRFYFDKDNDGVVKGQNKQLKVWVDIDGDAKTDKGELQELSKYGIFELVVPRKGKWPQVWRPNPRRRSQSPVQTWWRLLLCNLRGRGQRINQVFDSGYSHFLIWFEEGRYSEFAGTAVEFNEKISWVLPWYSSSVDSENIAVAHTTSGSSVEKTIQITNKAPKWCSRWSHQNSKHLWILPSTRWFRHLQVKSKSLHTINGTLSQTLLLEVESWWKCRCQKHCSIQELETLKCTFRTILRRKVVLLRTFPRKLEDLYAMRWGCCWSRHL